MSDPNKTVIEVNGVKLEVDLRHAKRIDILAVGDRVKVLKKEYQDFKVYPGMVIGFEPFKERPTVIVAYIKTGYNEAGIEFVYYNTDSKEVEIVKALDDDMLGLEKAFVVRNMDRLIETKRREMEELMAKKDYFLEKFQAYWSDIDRVVAGLEGQA